MTGMNLVHAARKNHAGNTMQDKHIVVAAAAAGFQYAGHAQLAAGCQKPPDDRTAAVDFIRVIGRAAMDFHARAKIGGCLLHARAHLVGLAVQPGLADRTAFGRHAAVVGNHIRLSAPADLADIGGCPAVNLAQAHCRDPFCRHGDGAEGSGRPF